MSQKIVSQLHSVLGFLPFVLLIGATSPLLIAMMVVDREKTGNVLRAAASILLGSRMVRAMEAENARQREDRIRAQLGPIWLIRSPREARLTHDHVATSNTAPKTKIIH